MASSTLFPCNKPRSVTPNSEAKGEDRPGSQVSIPDRLGRLLRFGKELRWNQAAYRLALASRCLGLHWALELGSHTEQEKVSW